MLLFVVLSTEQKIIANSKSTYLNREINENNKIIKGVELCQAALFIDSLFCMYQIFCNKQSFVDSMSDYNNRWTLDSILVLAGCLYVRHLRHQNNDLEKQINDLESVR